MENLSRDAFSHAELFARAEQWLAHDLDPETSEELRGLLARARQGDAAEAADAAAADAAAATAELMDRFDGRLKFGTAGLRAEVGAGPKRMNRVVVTQTSAGFAQFLLRRADRGEAKTPLKVVIGFDARKNSDVFARDAAEVFAGYGITPIVLPGPLPTPVTAFAVRYFEAAAGVMVTASHNPPRDNGYKVYLGDGDSGSQIIPPDDSEIAALIDEVASVPVGDIPRAEAPHPVDAEVVSAYVTATRDAVQTTRQALRVGDVSAAELSVVYTAMHGVGAKVTEQLFAAAKLPRLHAVTEQHTPDGSFPTVAFPNPEEPGALDLAYETARQVRADVVIAHDPDADRLAVALPDRDSGADATDAPKYTALTGNQLGLLLGWRMATAEAARIEGAQQSAAQLETPRALACTIVSSPALGAVADHFGFNYQETLSGFKWVSRVPGLAFGFEEALGYLVHPRVVHDKDGISAAAELVAWAEELKHSGKTLWDALAEIHETIGYFASTQVTVRLDSAAAVEALAERLRAVSPTSFGSVAVHRSQDLSVPGASPVPANVLRYDLADGSRVMVRPSGTEPKLKLYLDTSSREGDIAARTAIAEARLEQLTASVEQLLKDLSAS